MATNQSHFYLNFMEFYKPGENPGENKLPSLLGESQGIVVQVSLKMLGRSEELWILAESLEG